MRRVVTGEQIAQIYNPDPFARPIWRAPVYQTPFGIIAVAHLFRLLAWIIRMILRHPVAATAVSLLAFAWVSIGWIADAALVAWAVLVLVTWRCYWPGSFTRWVAAPARGKWRAWWCYRRRWEAVMNVADLAPWYRGRILMPVLGKVAATRYTDRVAVRLVSGQCMEDFAKRADNLAHGFGAMICRIRSARSGALVLEFVRRDALAAIIPAVIAGVVLVIGAAEAIARVWPYLVAGLAVIAGLWTAGWLTRAVMAYRQQQAAWRAEVTGAAHDDLRDRELAALRQAVKDLDARLAARAGFPERPGLERHDHVHFHGLAAEQIAAVLAARPPDRGGQW
jgi:hypothetical protein